jgi:hypothetical protein
VIGVIIDQDAEKKMFKQLLESSIKATMKQEFPDIRSIISEHDDYITLGVVLVKADDRRKHKATDFMKRLIELAKKENKDIFLTPDDGYSGKGDMTTAELTKWYKKLGFKNKSKSDFRAMEKLAYYV